MEQVRLSSEKCPDCAGTGYIASKKKISVTIPAGIDNGQSVRIRDKGEPGVNGGPRGDLLVAGHMYPDIRFSSVRMYIFSQRFRFPLHMAALGADIRIKTVDGEVSLQCETRN